MKSQKREKNSKEKIFKLAKIFSGPIFTYKETNDSQYFSQGCNQKTAYNGIMITKLVRDRDEWWKTKGECLNVRWKLSHQRAKE